MNFVIIMTDSLRPDFLSPYGNTWVHTPAAQRFAESAAVFDNYYCGSWPTVPNRTDLFTGRFGEPIHYWLPLGYDELTFQTLLAEQGYVTQLICDTPHLIQGGANFDFPFHAWDFIRGQEVDHYGMDHDPIALPFQDASKVRTPAINTNFSQYLRNVRGRRYEEDWATWKTYQSAVNWLERNYKQEKFLLWIDSFDPHEPPDPPQKYIDMYDPGYDGQVFLTHINAPLLTPKELFHVKARYAGAVTFADRCVGRLLQALDDLKLADATCVIWISDHGTHVGEHGRMMGKAYMYNEVARSVLMFRVPGGPAAGKRFSHLVQPADIAPAVLDLAGVPVPKRMQGKSFVPLLRGEPFETRKAAVTGSTPKVGKNNLFLTIRDTRWVLVDHDKPDRRELFDLKNDPGQQANVVAQYPAEAERLHLELVSFLKTHDAQPQLVRLFETGDPGDMTGYQPIRPGFEAFTVYFQHTYNSHVLPE